MRKIFVLLVAAVVTLGLSAPQAFGQPPAPAAPAAPKVTISGLVDFVTSLYHNISTGNITQGGDNGWYSRERGVFTVTGEVGAVKGVVAFELDFVNGKTANVGTAGPGSGASFDVETDEKGQVETKWLYLEAPITGANSLLPFLPMRTTGRFGAQPARGHDYKPGILLSGDFPGASFETMWAPNLTSTLTYVQVDEALDRVINPGGTEDYAIVASVAFDVFKGLTIKPTYSFARYYNGANGDGNHGLYGRGGLATTTAREVTRHTIGGDVRWTTGPFTLAPTFFYQMGERDAVIAAGQSVDINAWIFDVVAGFRTGPLNVEVRGSVTSGNKANECPQASGGCTGGDDINYYEQVSAGTTGFWSGWAELEASGVDYNMTLNPASAMRLGGSPSYDKYGRMIVGAAVDYAVTPALTFFLLTNVQWTMEKVDTDGTLSANGITPSAAASGDDKYLGNEWDLGFNYRFAPNVVFTMVGAYLFAGDARGVNGASPDDVYRITARMRVTW